MIFEISQNIARRVFEKAITDLDKCLRDKKNTSLPVLVISSMPVPAIKTDQVKLIIS